MPTITTDDGAQINVLVEGPADAPPLVLSNSLGADLHMWDPQAPALTKHFRLIRYDRRGHGQSTAPKTPGSMERLGRDVLAIADSLKLERFNWCGLSMGGMVGQWLAANAPDRIEKMVISNTHYYYPDKAPWNDRIRTAREKGVGSLAQVQIERWFTPEYIAARSDVTGHIARVFSETKLDGYVACCEAGRDMDFRESNTRIKAPTLVIVGTKDWATPPEAGEAIHKAIEGSSIATIEAAHMSNFEKPDEYTRLMLDFLR